MFSFLFKKNRFIYCGKVDLTKLQGPDVLKLLIAVDEINIQTLINYIQEYLIKQQDKFLQQNPIEIFEMVYQHENFSDLWNFCLDKICAEPDTLFNSEKFISLKAPLLELLLKRDDLLLDEIVIWNHLIKWCFAQNSNISQDVTKWNKEEITMMGRTIHRFVPLIRFYHISSEDFMTKVYPFNKIIPEDLIQGILMFHMAPDELNVDIKPPRKPKYVYDSVIIESQHFAIFSNWIEKKSDSHYNVRNISYNFNLIYRASRDGNTAAAFHAKCDNKGATMVVVKVPNSEQIVGGYNPLYWDSSDSHKSTRDSFIFSFKNRNNFKSNKVSYSDGYDSVGGYLDYGPIFGSSGNLSYRFDNSWNWCSNSTPKCYSNIDSAHTDVKAEDYEVFQVVKR